MRRDTNTLGSVLHVRTSYLATKMWTAGWPDRSWCLISARGKWAPTIYLGRRRREWPRRSAIPSVGGA